MIVQHDGVVTITGSSLLAQAYRATLDGIARRRRDGLPTTDLLELARALRAAHTVSLQCREVDLGATEPEDWEDQSARDWCDVAEAALLLGLSKRQVQRMARGPGGLEAIRVGRVWKLRRAPLLVQAKERYDGPDRIPGELASARRAPAGRQPVA